MLCILSTISFLYWYMQSASQTHRQKKDALMQHNTETQLSGPLSSGNGSIVEFGFLSAFFAVLTMLLVLVFFVWQVMIFFVLWILPLSTLSTFIFGCIILFKVRKRFAMRRSVIVALLSLAIGLLSLIGFFSTLLPMMH